MAVSGFGKVVSGESGTWAIEGTYGSLMHRCHYHCRGLGPGGARGTFDDEAWLMADDVAGSRCGRLMVVAVNSGVGMVTVDQAVGSLERGSSKRIELKRAGENGQLFSLGRSH